MLSAFSTVTTGPIAAEAASDFTFVGLLLDADIFVRFILIVLLIASLWSWAVIIEKSFSLRAMRKAAERFEDSFWSGRSDEDVGRPGHESGDAASRVFASASREWNESRRVTSLEQVPALVDRAERAMRTMVDREIGRASRGIGVLATVGSASPFIGLLGTVWGIMYAFINIATSQDTSLGVVAGPIAEALFATGLGLIAAIPATIFYNKFTGDIANIADQLDAFSQDVLVRLARRAADQLGS